MGRKRRSRDHRAARPGHWPCSTARAEHGTIPFRSASCRTENGFEPVARRVFRLRRLAAAAPRAVNLGLDGLKRVELRWGFQDDALWASSASWPRAAAALARLARSADVRASELTTLPAGLSGFAVLSADVPKTYDQIVELVQAGQPRPRRRDREFRGTDRPASWRRPSQGRARAPRPEVSFYAQAAGTAESITRRPRCCASSAGSPSPSRSAIKPPSPRRSKRSSRRSTQP